MSWTDERVELLKRLWIEGHSASQIAGQLGGVTRNAVIGKVHRLGLSGRTTPSRPVKRPPRLARPRPRTAPAPAPAPAPALPVRAPQIAAAAAAAEEAAPSPARLDKAAVLAALPPVTLPDGQTASILTLRDSMCKWPIGDPADANFAFCGRKAECGPYCKEHASVAFQPARKRDRKRDEFDFVRRIAG